jgi:murein DD-endopeptidase MepM/ murein hydrolase activator NlpD
VQIQFHPASGRGIVRTVSLSARGERWVLAGAAALALFAVSLWITVPAVARQAERSGQREQTVAESRRSAAASETVERLAAQLRDRARGTADLLNRAAFLYGIPTAAWPRALAPEHRLLSGRTAEATAAALPVFMRALENARTVLAASEARDAGAPRVLPSILPLEEALFEPSAYFGPRRSPWTSEEEFLAGVEIAAPAGTVVVAPAAGTVAFAGAVRPRPAGYLWQLGNVIVLAHGEGGATVFGHLSSIAVKRGQRVERGTRLGLVGSTGWALSPQLHYEYWRPESYGRQDSPLRPTDPLFAVLDYALMPRPYSLEQMEATWAPGPLEPLPGIGMPAEEASAGRPAPPRRVHRRSL